MKKLLVLFLLVFASLSFLFAGEKTVYPVHVKWTVSVFSGKIEPLGEDPYEVEITVEENNTCSLLIPALYMSPDYPPTESGVLEGVSYTVDKKGNVDLKYVFPKEEQDADMTLDSITGTIKKGKLELKMKLKMKGVPFDLTIKFDSI